MIPLEYWLEMLRQRRWTLQCGVDWMAAHWAWPDCADVVIIRDEDDATAFRMPTENNADVLDPAWVTWVYAAPAVWTLRAVLTLPVPGTPGEPVCLMTAPASCRVPRQGRRPVTVRRLSG